MAENVPSLEAGVRKIKIPINTPATTIIRQQTVDTQIKMEHLLLLETSGFSAINVKSKVFCYAIILFLLGDKMPRTIVIMHTFFQKFSQFALGAG